MKNIVVCCDGTNNDLRGNSTNVVRLFEIVINDGRRQVAFYDPGVGTLADPRAQGPISKRWSVIKGLAFGTGLKKNVLDAYVFLMRVYEPGDHIFLFGFSRGAFTARVLAGMLHTVGLLQPRTDNLLPYLWRNYRGIRALPPDPTPAEQAAADSQWREVSILRRSFTRPCPVAFLGPWDTVGSVGLYNWNQSFAYTFENPGVAVIRHAVSLDEHRAAFSSNVFKADSTPVLDYRPRVMNVWFPGVHCDVGGGYPWPNGSALAMIAFNWIVQEAASFGLLIDDVKWKALRDECRQDASGTIHDSLSGLWKAMEYLPARRYDWSIKKTVWRYQPNRPRTMIESPTLHQSVPDRMAARHDYNPPNLPKNNIYPREPWTVPASSGTFCSVMPYKYPCRLPATHSPLSHCAICQGADCDQIVNSRWAGSSEPQIIYQLFFSNNAVTDWTNYMRHWQPSLLYAGVFIHQRPYCEFNPAGSPPITIGGAHACRCELGDLLLVFTDIPTQRRTALFFQAKMAGGPWPPLRPNPDQWNLYTNWPTFRYTPRSPSINPGPQVRTLPFSGSQHCSAQYAELDPSPPTVETTNAVSIASRSGWDRTIHLFLNGGAGRDFSYQRSTATDDWDHLIWDLLDYTYQCAMPRSISSWAGGDRGAGAFLSSGTMLDTTGGEGPGENPPSGAGPDDDWGIPVVHFVREGG